jgi:2,4-dienoyl-CoA reductase-like NADH-dependent reductase (Old Yellow Enzyme family)
MRPLAPSAVLDERTQRMPEEMTQGEIDAAVQAFADAAVRAKRAGYDGVQLHGAHGYLLCSFLNPELNRRTDEYGGSAENRFRIVAESIRAVREAVGPDYPVWVRLNSNITGAGDADYANDLLYQARQCKALGADLLELSGADYTARGRAGMRLYYLERAAWVKEQTDFPVALVGGIRSLKDMDETLAKGISLVSIGRPFICEPDLITRLINGQPEAKCVSCSQCFRLDASYRETGVRCALWGEKP